MMRLAGGRWCCQRQTQEPRAMRLPPRGVDRPPHEAGWTGAMGCRDFEGQEPGAHEELSSLRLTPAEREVLKAFACFDSSREIAERLVVTQETVKWHTKSLFRKLGVRSRAHAIGR